MDLKYKRVGLECLEQLVDARIAFILDMHPEYDSSLISAIREKTSAYLQELLEKNCYIGFLGINADAAIICTAGLLIYFLPPLHEGKYRKIGHVLNFFTILAYRRRGLGLKLMEFIKVTAREEGIERLVLNATEMGYGLYQKAGFTEPEMPVLVHNL